jgi:hypothetical protein
MRDKLINAALLISTIIFSLVVLEIGLRIYHGEWDYTNFRYPQQNKFAGGYHIYDPELGWVPKPGKTNVWGTTVTIDEGGIRSNGDGEVWDGTGDPILAIGDSYTFGDQVSNSETWPAQLEKLSGKRVINGGVDGYGVDQEFLRARRLMSHYQFSTVIFSFIPDDIRRSQMSVMFATAKPYFDFKKGRLTLENIPVPPSPRRPRENSVLIVLEHSMLVHTVMKRLFPEWWFRMSSETQVQDREKGIKVACTLLHELEGLTKARGSELIVLAEHGEVETSWESMASQSVLRCLSDPAIRVLDLKPALSKIKAKDPSRYHGLYNPFLHMSAEGNEFVAHEILPIMAERSTQVNQNVLPPASARLR